MKDTRPIQILNVREIKALIADAPPNFSERAESASLSYSEENAEWGTRFVVNFEDIPFADQAAEIVKDLLLISADATKRHFDQIWLESR